MPAVQLQQGMRYIKKAVGFTDLKFHDLGDEAISRLGESGFSAQEVGSISDHKSMQMLKRYTHLRSEDLVTKIDNIGKR